MWHYLGSFIVYTLAAIALIYGMFVVLKKNPRLLALLTMSAIPVDKPVALAVETSMALEARKTLYIIRSGDERFLIATSPEGTQFLSRLETNIKNSNIEEPAPATNLVQETDTRQLALVSGVAQPVSPRSDILMKALPLGLRPIFDKVFAQRNVSYPVISKGQYQL